MKVAFVNKHCELGGIETVVQQLFRGMTARGIHCDFWFSESPGRARGRSLKPMYPRLLDRLQHTRFAGLVERVFPRARWTGRTFEALRDRPYDLIHVHGFDETYASLESLRALACAKPLALTLHGAWFFTGGCGQPAGCGRYADACGQCPQTGEWPVPMVDNTAEQLTRKHRVLHDAPIHFISPSLHLREKALRSTPGKRWSITHLPNGVDTEFFYGRRKRDAGLRRAHGVEPGQTIVLAMCRDFRDPVKGVPIMAAALQALALDNVQVVLVGAFGEALASQLPPRLKPIVLGYVSDIQARRDLFAMADVFLFSSIAETFPCVILEAMSSECCVVSTPLESVREQLKHGHSGFIAEDFTGEALARELARACLFPALAAAIATNARVVVQGKFSEKTMLDSHEEFYRGLLA